MIKRLESLSKLLLINFNRLIDHAVRFTSGLPTMKRSKITPEIFLGGQYSPKGLKKLKEMGITSILNMRTTSFEAAAKEAGINYLQVPTPDYTAPSLELLEGGIQFIDRVVKAKGKVYIHCRAGEGRGPTMVIAYLIKTGLTLGDALTHVQKVRSFARPTAVQMARLREVEKKYKKPEPQVKPVLEKVLKKITK
jgi:dual specificity MAP kinase phosphatase